MEPSEIVPQDVELLKAIQAGDNESALRVSKILEEVHRARGQFQDVAELLSCQAEAHRQMGNDDLAIAAFLKCIVVVSEVIKNDQFNRDAKTLLRGALGNVADMFHARREYSGALACYSQMADVASSLGELHWQQAALNNKGHVLWKMGKLTEAVVVFQEQESVAAQIQNYEECVKSLCCRAQIFRNMKDTARATQSVKGAIAIVQQAGLDHLLAEVVAIELGILADAGE